jgi:phosphoenolpyruvate carboxykinase (GTP)
MKSHTSHFRFLPVKDSPETKGLEIKAHDLETTSSVDLLGWREAVPQIRDHYAAFGDRLPNELATALDALESSLN